jgi:hypothetical protein
MLHKVLAETASTQAMEKSVCLWKPFQYKLYSRTFMVAAHPNFLNGIFFRWKSETLKKLLPPRYSQKYNYSLF